MRALLRLIPLLRPQSRSTFLFFGFGFPSAFLFCVRQRHRTSGIDQAAESGFHLQRLSNAISISRYPSTLHQGISFSGPCNVPLRSYKRVVIELVRANKIFYSFNVYLQDRAFFFLAFSIALFFLWGWLY